MLVYNYLLYNSSFVNMLCIIKLLIVELKIFSDVLNLLNCIVLLLSRYIFYFQCKLYYRSILLVFWFEDLTPAKALIGSVVSKYSWLRIVCKNVFCKIVPSLWWFQGFGAYTVSVLNQITIFFLTKQIAYSN